MTAPDLEGAGVAALVLGRLAEARVLVLGDVMLDRFVHGQVERISPEAPIPVLMVERETTMPGGAGNVAANLAALGVSARLLSVCGADAPGGELRRLLVELLGDTEGLVPEAGRRTTVKTRFVAGGQQVLRADRETATPIAPRQEALMLDMAGGWMAESDAVILSDYGKGLLTPSLTQAIIELARAAGKPVIVDPKGTDYTRYRGADIVTPNRRELAAATGLPTEDDVQVVQAALHMIASAGVGAVLATRGEQGATLVTADGNAQHLRCTPRDVFDVSGAGDTVAAVLAAMLAAGASMADAAHMANLAGGIVVGKAGTATVRAEELRDALRRTGSTGPGGKLVGREALVETVARWRRAGLRIGFTNGCFDLLHPGHVHLIDQARAACDRLIVGLNSDASVTRLKGPGRPVQGEAARAAVLAGLSSVDRVTFFEEDTPLALIQAIRPDVLVKGADYTVATVVGADLVIGWGGRVVLAELAQGHSTTGIVDKLKG